ncbi:hypothetical protein ABS71_07355 [bacterium SCN 62-11]|nr:HAMP domain-containing histidine kinase [Candidatus Eremiobacteraeota bacterium]ODT73377.1 MAG: hypothetical protein ABS71_07355 [bacterium SCN 62-11]
MSLSRTRLRLLLLNLAGLLALLSLVCIGSYSLVRRQLYERLQQELLLTAHAVTFSVERESHGVDFHESIYLADRPLQIDLRETCTVEWLDAQGKVLAQRGVVPMPSQDLRAEQYFYGPLSCSYTLPAQEKGQIYGYARVALPLAPLRKQLSDLLGMLVLTGTLTLAAAAGLGWWWTGRSLRPLQLAYDDLSLFAGSVSHELRSPLTAMLTQCQSLLRHFDRIEKEEIREGLQELSESSSDMARLVNDLLMLAQARRHHSDLPLEPQSVAEVVGEARGQMAPTSKQVDIQVQSDPQTVLAHRPYLLLILRNLLENAVQYSDSGTRVQVSWQGRGRQLQITVSDQGVGLSAEACARVFEPFWRADRSRARHAGGTGLGLAIAHSLAQAMGGELSVTSQPGQGSQFHILLPFTKS